jgi:UDP-N-acetylglucosamine--N-acetylmuramyl-(pentapeptide) pyrophosphoryl-undecaprenol N-acetylglucosamine transferase
VIDPSIQETCGKDLRGGEALRVYFGVCGIGLGHAGRCIPIAGRLIEKGAEVLFSTYRDGVKYVEQAGFPVVKAPAVGFVVKADGTVDFRQTVANPGPILASFTLTKQVEAEIKFMRAFEPDVVISDSRVSPLLAAKILDIPDICVLNQFQIIIPRRSRLLRLAKLVDTGALAMIGKLWTSGATHLMIPDFPPPYVLSAGNLRIPKAYQRRVKLIGPILPVHPDDLPSKEELRSSLGLDVDSQLVYLPISGPAKERAYITGLLRRIVLDLPESYQVVMSLGYPNMSIRPIHKGNVSIYGWVPNRFEYLKACDLVVSRAGHGTLTQSICYGKPMVLIPTPSHTEQVNNALRVKELGIAEVLDQKDVSRDTLAEVIDRMLSDESCQKRAEEVQKDISGLNGLKTAVETIMQVAQNN